VIRSFSLFDLWKVLWFPIIVLTVHILLFRWSLGLYKTMPWIDGPVHYLGGFSIAYSLLILIKEAQSKGCIQKIEPIIKWVLVIGLVATVAVLWELLEFTLDRVMGTNVQVSLQNTMKDLLTGVMGGVTLVLFRVFSKSK